MIISKIISGLGNQLFQYVVGKQLALEKKVELKLDISFFSSQNLRNYKLNAYNINSRLASENEINKFTTVYSSKTLYSRLYRKTEKFLPRTKRRFFKEETPWQYEPELFKVSSDIYLDGYWQHYKYFTNIEPSILKELVVKEVYESSLQSVLYNVMNNSNAVSIHIRRGDYISDKVAYNLMGILPLSYYYSAVAYIKQHIPTPNFYIFSDDLDWVKKNLIINDYCNYIDSGKDYIDLDLMSKCKHNIIANSSFSWWSAFLNQNPNKIVIGPKQWVVPTEINNRIELLFPSWIKI